MRERRAGPVVLIYVVIGDDVFNVAEVLRGVASVAAEGNGTVLAVTSVPSREQALREHPRSGVIAMPGQGGHRPGLSEWAGAAVGLHAYEWDPGVAIVTPDNYAVGVMAAEHLLERGYRRLAFFGVEQPWAQSRAEGFVWAAAAGGVQASVFMAGHWDAMFEPPCLGRWLEFLSGPPVGVMACNDVVAARLLDAATDAGRHVPDDVGIIGVDNYELRTAYGWIPISSIDVNSRRLGMEAARLLMEEMLPVGSVVGVVHRRVPPAGVVARQSTDALAIGDPDVAAAVRLIRRGDRAVPTADEIARELKLSRATLDRRFKQALGRTVAEELLRVRLAEARRRLESTDDRLSQVASDAGFKHLSNFSAAFRRAFGKSPSRWRAELGCRSAGRRGCGRRGCG